jgi:hypothetical protein
VLPEQRVVELFHINAYWAEPVNPVPVALIVAPTSPLFDEIVNEGVTKKLVLGWLDPCVAVMVPLPPGSMETVNEQENPPLESVVIVVPFNPPTQHAVGAKSIPSRETVAPNITANPDPTTVNGLPTGP